MTTMSIRTTVWGDRFTQPNETDLVSMLTGDEQALVQYIIEKCTDLGADQRSVRWQGIPWRWTIQIGMKDESSIGFLIAEPGRPQLAIPLTASDLDRIPMRRLSKSVRDSILGARAVSSMLWPEWDITSKTQIDELMAMMKVRCETVQSAGKVRSD